MFCRMEEHFVLNEEKRTLEAKLTETVECYFQINRGEIVNINFIEKIEPYFGDRLAISIKNHKQHLITSASATSEFRKWLE